MRFKFCGDLDAPDWLLKEISTLSKISGIKIRLLCNEIIKHLQGSEIEYENIYKHTAGANLEDSDVKAVVASLNFIIFNSAKYNVNGDTVAKELQQLGLPKEHSEAVSKVYLSKKDVLREVLRGQTLKLGQLVTLEWRVDYLISSSSLSDLNVPTVQLQVTAAQDQARDQLAFEVSADKLRVLLSELQTAKAMMDKLEV
jgi:hypothetical protein